MLDPLKARLDEKDHYNAMPEELPEHFAESVVIGLLAEDGTLDLSLRLARFPQSGKAHIWLHVAAGEGAWSLVDEVFELDYHNATPVTEDDATFDASHRDQRVSFASRNRNGLLQGSIEANLLVTPTRHPQVGPGTVPALIQLQFSAASPGFRSPTKRWELTGRTAGVVTIGDQSWQIHHDGKWHEQTGSRPKFAPAFTDFNIQNSESSIVVIGRQQATGGYADIAGEVSKVVEFSIEAQGPADRGFSITLENGRSITGVARVVQRWSVPIEGKRRPGSSVLVESNIGSFRGSLNDWEPPL